MAALPYIHLMRLHKPVGTYLLLWPTLTALWLAAKGIPDIKLIIIFTLGVVLTRSAGCVINDYADRDFDKHVARTQDRPLTSGAISPRAALALFVVLLLTAFALVIQTNHLTILLSLAAVFLMASYPFMKRFIHAPQLVLGLAFSWAVPMAFAAQTGSVPLESIWLMGYVIFWAVAYDTMYAMVDYPDDIKVGIKSSAILFYPHERLWIGLFQILALACLLITGIVFQLSAVYFTGLAAALALAGYHQWLIRDRNLAQCFHAFLHNHWLGLCVFIATVLAYYPN